MEKLLAAIVLLIFCGVVYLVFAGVTYTACMIMGTPFHWLMPFGVMFIYAGLRALLSE